MTLISSKLYLKEPTLSTTVGVHSIILWFDYLSRNVSMKSKLNLISCFNIPNFTPFHK
jgi:hypothetical protein